MEGLLIIGYIVGALVTYYIISRHFDRVEIEAGSVSTACIMWPLTFLIVILLCMEGLFIKNS